MQTIHGSLAIRAAYATPSRSADASVARTAAPDDRGEAERRHSTRSAARPLDPVVKMEHRHPEKADRMVTAEHARSVDVDSKLLVQCAHPPDHEPILSDLAHAIEARVAECRAFAPEPQVALLVERGL